MQDIKITLRQVIWIHWFVWLRCECLLCARHEEYRDLKSWFHAHSKDQHHGPTSGQKKHLNVLNTYHHFPVLCSWQTSLINHSNLFLWIKLKPPNPSQHNIPGSHCHLIGVDLQCGTFYYPGIRGTNIQVTNISLKNTAYLSLLFNSLPSHALDHRQQQNIRSSEKNGSLLLCVQRRIMGSQNHVSPAFLWKVLTAARADKPRPLSRAGVRPWDQCRSFSIL